MNPWLPGSELRGIATVPATGGSLSRWVARHSVGRRKAPVGKGWEYRFDTLPDAVQAALREREAAERQAEQARALILAEPQPQLPVADDLDEPVALADWQRDVAQDRLAVLALAEQWQDSGLSARQAFGALLDAAATGALSAQQTALITAANARAGSRSRVTVSTLYRWSAERGKALAAGQDPLVALAPASAQTSEPMPAWMASVMGHYRKPSKPSISAAYRDFIKQLPDSQRASAPSLRTVQRHVQALPVELREYGRLGRRAMRAVQPFVRRTTDGLWPMDVVTVDGHAAKCYVRRPDSARRIRPEITTYLDIATRRIVGYSVWWAESQHAIWLALRQMVLDPRAGFGRRASGVPAIQYSDNGAYRGESHQAVLARLGTVPMFSEPYRAQARGAIERLNSSVWVPLARTQPTYCGRDTDQEHFKQALKLADESGQGILDWREWLGECDRAIAEYNAREHSSLRRGREQLTPDRAWQIALDEGWEPSDLGRDDLHDLLPAETRRCNRAEVRLPWGLYQHNDLRAYHGRDLRVHYDAADGSRVWVCEPDGRLICVAKRDGNARPYVSESALEHSRQQREQARVGRLEARIATAHAEETPLLEGETYDLPDLVLQTGETGGLLAAEPAAPAPEASRSGQVIDMQPERADDYLDRLEADPARYEAWRILRDRDAGGELLTQREQAFLDSFRQSGYCRAMEEMRADFDAQMGDMPGHG